MPTHNLTRDYNFKGRFYLMKDNPQECPADLIKRDKVLSGQGDTEDLPEAESGFTEDPNNPISDSADGVDAQAVDTSDTSDTADDPEEPMPIDTDSVDTDSVEPAPDEPAPDPVGFPEDFPHVPILMEAGYHEPADLKGVHLEGIPRIGKERAEDIREALKAHRGG